jgi:hypothetical protein
MPITKAVHIGGIEYLNKTVFIAVDGCRTGLWSQLNNFLFDYGIQNNTTIVQLPALDDWTHNDTDPTYWEVMFPDKNWKIWIRKNFVEFK